VVDITLLNQTVVPQQKFFWAAFKFAICGGKSNQAIIFFGEDLLFLFLNSLDKYHG